MLANLSNFRFSVALLVAVVLVYAMAPPAAAQVVTGTIGGTVLDTQGSAIPNAMISVTNRDTGLVRTTTSESSGGFTVTDLPSGPYSINVTAGGFQQQVRNGVTLTVGATLRLDFRLSVGQVEQTVTVTEEAPQVDTTTSTLSGLVSDTSIRQLPLNGRDWLQLTALQSGVLVGLSKNPDSGENVTHGGGIFLTVSGGRPTSNVFMVDGLVINDEANKSPGSTVDGVNLGVDGIKEFSVLTSTFSAEFGRSSGGVVNAITKSGTNSIHGTAFGFLRNSALDASNYFTGDAPFHRSQFGGALGGPIKKNKLFYFGDYEGLRQFLAESQPTFTISDQARAGTVVLPGGGQQAPIPANVRPYLALFPEETSKVLDTSFIAPLSFPGGTRGTEDYALGRIDYVPTSNISIHGTYNFDRSISSSPDGVGLKTVGSVQRAQRVTLGLQYTIRPTLINTINAGFNRVVGTGNIDVPGSSTNAAYTNTALSFLPNIAQNPGTIIIGDLSPDGVRGVPGGIGATGGDQIWWTDPQVNDNLVWVKGRNNIRFGFSFEAIRDFLSVGRFPLGDWEFDNTQDFLAGNAPTAFNASLLGASAAYRHMREKIFGFYVQDDVRVRSNLTVNLGVRYEPTTTYDIQDGLGSTFTSLTAANITTGNTVTQNPTLRDFSPRVGFAWDPTGSGKNSIRAGFGVFNILPLPNVLSGNINHAIPFFPLVQAGGTTNPLTSANFPNNPPTSANGFTGYFIQQNPPEAYKMEWNLDVQRQITNSMSITAAYVGARGVHLPVRYGDMNLVPPNLATYVNGFLTFPAGSPVINSANSKLVIPATMWNTDSRYNALQVNLVQRVTRGLTFQVAYAWSNSIDEGSSEVNGNDNFNTTDNPYPFFPYLNRGVADWDVPQHVSLNFDYLVPSPHHFSNVVPRFLTSGWELGGIFLAQSGMPFSVQAQGDPAGTGTHLGRNTSQRADYIGGPGCTPNAVNPNNPAKYIMAQCFADPLVVQNGTPQGHIGDSGRNSLRVPGNQNFDLSLFKNQKMFNERLAVQFRAEFFNLFNWTDFGPHTEALFAAPKKNTSGVLQPGLPIPGNIALIGPTAFDQREIQFGLKFVF